MLFSNLSLDALKRVRAALDNAISGSHVIDGVDVLVDNGQKHVRPTPAAVSSPAAAGSSHMSGTALRDARIRLAQRVGSGLFDD